MSATRCSSSFVAGHVDRSASMRWSKDITIRSAALGAYRSNVVGTRLSLIVGGQIADISRRCIDVGQKRVPSSGTEPGVRFHKARRRRRETGGSPKCGDLLGSPTMTARKRLPFRPPRRAPGYPRCHIIDAVGHNLYCHRLGTADYRLRKSAPQASFRETLKFLRREHRGVRTKPEPGL
jgi:hypothetical protein